MNAVLTATCSCGCSVTASCPTLGGADRAPAFAAIEAAGFVWDGQLGYRCPVWPTCSAEDVTGETTDRAPQRDLFGEAA